MSSAPLVTTEPRSSPPLGRGRRFRRYLWRLVLFWTVYTLSIGPLFWAWFESVYLEGSPLIFAFYLPLLLTCEFIPWWGWIVNAYVNLWIL